jgi:hypothetical protein
MITFQFPIKFDNKNGKYVKQEHCHEAQEKIRQEIADLKVYLQDYFNTRIEDLKFHFNQRFEDLKDFILRNGHNKNMP